MDECFWCGALIVDGVCSSCAGVDPDEYDWDHDERENRYYLDVDGMPG